MLVRKRFSNYSRRFHINYIIKRKKLLRNELMTTSDQSDCEVGWLFYGSGSYHAMFILCFGFGRGGFLSLFVWCTQFLLLKVI